MHIGTVDRRTGTVMVLTDEGLHVPAQMFHIPIRLGVDLLATSASSYNSRNWRCPMGSPADP